MLLWNSLSAFRSRGHKACCRDTLLESVKVVIHDLHLSCHRIVLAILRHLERSNNVLSLLQTDSPVNYHLWPCLKEMRDFVLDL